MLISLSGCRNTRTVAVVQSLQYISFIVQLPWRAQYRLTGRKSLISLGELEA